MSEHIHASSVLQSTMQFKLFWKLDVPPPLGFMMDIDWQFIFWQKSIWFKSHSSNMICRSFLPLKNNHIGRVNNVEKELNSLKHVLDLGYIFVHSYMSLFPSYCPFECADWLNFQHRELILSFEGPVFQSEHQVYQWHFGLWSYLVCLKWLSHQGLIGRISGWPAIHSEMKMWFWRALRKMWLKHFPNFKWFLQGSDSSKMKFSN